MYAAKRKFTRATALAIAVAGATASLVCITPQAASAGGTIYYGSMPGATAPSRTYVNPYARACTTYNRCARG
ncbi:MAG TPA: hypothetical protein VK453_02490 [Micromonosporaceae bacterium]|nr:hypothetical protein [Micromonosporaceae bacterium]